jgi:hypothetical protein
MNIAVTPKVTAMFFYFHSSRFSPRKGHTTLTRSDFGILFKEFGLNKRLRYPRFIRLNCQ